MLPGYSEQSLRRGMSDCRGRGFNRIRCGSLVGPAAGARPAPWAYKMAQAGNGFSEAELQASGRAGAGWGRLTSRQFGLGWLYLGRPLERSTIGNSAG